MHRHIRKAIITITISTINEIFFNMLLPFRISPKKLNTVKVATIKIALGRVHTT
jgi:hypothetical protein